MTSQNLILLGLLMDGPQHGYDLKQKVDRSLSDIGPITSGTIYYTLRRLEDRQWVSSHRERSGSRPERIVYEITDAGKAAFQELLQESLTTPERPWFLFDVGLYFAPHVSPEFLLSAVETKLQELEQSRQRAAEIDGDDPQRWPFHLRFIRERWQRVMDAHEDWYRDLMNTVRKMQKDNK